VAVLIPILQLKVLSGDEKGTKRTNKEHSKPKINPLFGKIAHDITAS
jgi:hypothetical protein